MTKYIFVTGGVISGVENKQIPFLIRIHRQPINSCKTKLRRKILYNHRSPTFTWNNRRNIFQNRKLSRVSRNHPLFSRNRRRHLRNPSNVNRTLPKIPKRKNSIKRASKRSCLRSQKRQNLKLPRMYPIRWILKYQRRNRNSLNGRKCCIEFFVEVLFYRS